MIQATYCASQFLKYQYIENKYSIPDSTGKEPTYCFNFMFKELFGAVDKSDVFFEIELISNTELKFTILQKDEDVRSGSSRQLARLESSKEYLLR